MAEIEDEFITKSKPKKPAFETKVREDGQPIVVIDRKRVTPADDKIINALIIGGHKPVYKRADISKNDMIRYVKNNYDKEELQVLMEKLNTMSTTDEETDTLITFATIKSWFKKRYKYYPKGINYNFGKSKTGQEKKERFIKAFEEHKRELKRNNNEKDNISIKNNENNHNQHNNNENKGNNHNNNK